MNHRLAHDHRIKMSILHALAQSTKLSVYEGRAMALVEDTKDLPELLATTGKVRRLCVWGGFGAGALSSVLLHCWVGVLGSWGCCGVRPPNFTHPLPTGPTPPQVGLSRKKVAQLIGQVFIQKSAVNLLSTVLDTPEFFWSAPDSMQVCWCGVPRGVRAWG